MIILDTDVLIDIFDKKSKRGEEVAARLADSKEEVWTTSLNLHEILYGCIKTGRPIEGLLTLRALPFTDEDSRLSGKIEAALEEKGAPVRRMDTMIAATAINLGAKFLTFNSRHFERMMAFGLRFFEYPRAPEGEHPEP